MNISTFVKKLRNIQDNVLNDTDKVVLKLGQMEYEIDYVLINEQANKCVLKIDDTAELDIVHRIIESYKKTNEDK